MRPLQLFTTLDREFGAAVQSVFENHDGSICVTDVLQCPFGKTSLLQFSNGVAIWNFSKLIEPARWTPTTALHSVLQRHVECGAIDARLPTRNDFHDQVLIQSRL